ncbi:MAG: SDR family NAD(P)-dependent oxidoreductase [Trueperaceae bacterium]
MESPIVLVTGAGGALGRAVRERLTADGVRLALLDRRVPSGDAKGADADAPWAAAVDLLDEAAVADAVARVESELGPVRAALLLAGGFGTAPAAETDLTTLRGQLDLNLATAASVVRALLPHMTKRGEGTIIGIAAGQARRGGSGAAAYAASKAALAAYLRAVDEETASHGVRTVTVFPMGTLDTPANREAMPGADPARWIDPERLADVLAFAARIGPRARLREVELHPDG